MSADPLSGVKTGGGPMSAPGRKTASQLPFDGNVFTVW